jgi:outer membrane usher protein
MEGGVAASRAGGNGAAAYVTWRARPFRRASFVTQLRLMSDRYATTSLSPGADRALLRGSLGVVVSPAPGVTLNGEVTGVRQRDAANGIRAAVRGTWAVAAGRQLGLSASLARQAGASAAWEIFATFSMQLPYAHSLDLGARTGGTGESGWLTAARSLGVGPGVGYRVEARTGDGELAALDLRGQTTLGWAAFSERWIDPLTGASARHEALEAATGVVLIDGELHVTRPVEGSYALIVLDGAADVHVSLDGQQVGTTNSSGRLFIPGLLPYYGNRITIRDSDLPLDFKVNEVERYVAPRFRGGTVEHFDVGPTRVVVGRVVLALDDKKEARDVAPEWGEIAVELPTGRVVSPIGEGGAFWLEGLAAGRQEALVRWSGRLCRFTLDVAAKPGIVDVGVLRCVQMLATGELAGAAN